MSAPISELAAYRLARARETLTEAKDLSDGGHWHGVANRLYYACFYAVTAWLVQQGHSSPKHTGVRALVNRHLVQPGLFSRELGTLYNDLFELRQESDYEDFVQQSEAEVRPLVAGVEILIARVATLLEEEPRPL
ncbi:MAG: HEPN domain-containing protein [Candidatus Sericytochromatia bacterium]|nr:HEPN domain-containing protein [Candidatus Sericytochromatia bacterium]